jgi:hypothetical protein
MKYGATLQPNWMKVSQGMRGVVCAKLRFKRTRVREYKRSEFATASA